MPNWSTPNPRRDRTRLPKRPEGQADGLNRTSYRMADGREAANIELSEVTAEAVIGRVGEGHALMSAVVDDDRDDALASTPS